MTELTKYLVSNAGNVLQHAGDPAIALNGLCLIATLLYILSLLFLFYRIESPSPRPAIRGGTRTGQLTLAAQTSNRHNHHPMSRSRLKSGLKSGLFNVGATISLLSINIR